MGLIVAVIQTVMVLSMSYTLSRLRFKGRKFLMNFMLVLGMFPGFLTMIVLYRILSDINLYEKNAMWGLIIVYVASSGMGYYVSKGFFDTIPRSLDAKLPSYTVGDETIQLGSFKGFKMMGVKPQEDAKKAAVLNLLAQYLTGEKCQMDRYNQNGWGPSNKNAQNNDAIKNDPVLSALAAQNVFATPQGQYPGQWWDITQTLAASCKSAKSDAELTAALEAYYAAITALVGKVPASPANGPWGAIGVGGDWGTDKPMTKQADGSFLSDEAFTFAVGDSFKVRLDASWDHAFGDPSVATAGNNNPNYTVEIAGTYKIKLVITDADSYTGHIELVPVE